jgi:hypothetical protein
MEEGIFLRNDPDGRVADRFGAAAQFGKITYTRFDLDIGGHVRNSTPIG